MELRAFKIPPLALVVIVALLVVGELACGTGLYFVLMMSITMLCIGITYNMLGGLSRISGFLFAAMAGASIVISQFAKVLLFEPADHNLEAPDLTITVYAVYFFCAMVGVFVFSRVRLQLPKPLEPATASQSRLLYFVSLTVGVAASTVFWIDEFGTTAEQASLGHSLGLAFSYLILFSIVLAVDRRIRETSGRHSLDVWVIVSSIAVVCFQYLSTSRQGLVTPVVVYFVSCYVRGYRLKIRHYAGAAVCLVLFQTVISPFALYARPLMATLAFRDRIAKGYELLTSPPSQDTIRDFQLDIQTQERLDEYYDRPGTYVLSRFALIRADSDLIAACAKGFHYGFTALKIDLLRSTPRFIYRNKPDHGSGYYMAGIVGYGGEAEVESYWNFTSVSDSFGAFGWAGVVLFPLIMLPAIFIVYESMFDMARPWGTVALGLGVLHIWGTPMVGMLNVLIKDPLAILFLSWLVVGITRPLTAYGRESGLIRTVCLDGSLAED